MSSSSVKGSPFPLLLSEFLDRLDSDRGDDSDGSELTAAVSRVNDDLLCSPGEWATSSALLFLLLALLWQVQTLPLITFWFPKHTSRAFLRGTEVTLTTHLPD